MNCDIDYDTHEEVYFFNVHTNTLDNYHFKYKKYFSQKYLGKHNFMFKNAKYEFNY